MRALFVADPPETFDPRADSTYVMVTEAQRRGHEAWATTIDRLFLAGPHAFAHAARVGPASSDPGARLGFRSGFEPCALAEFDLVLMRKDPPFDEGYLTATWILDHAGHPRVVNDPAGLRALNEKLSMLAFDALTPPTRVLRRIDDLRQALADFGGRMIVKPVFGFGGREVLQARDDDPNLSTIFEMATRDETRWTVAQAFVEAAALGDKRILLVDGEPIGAVLRVPRPGELRDNFHTGGTAHATELDERDREICAALRPVLRQHGQYFVGIDVIGGLLTEINVTSPTGMQEVNRLDGLTGDGTTQARFWIGLEA
jgi:glutathione synthase